MAMCSICQGEYNKYASLKGDLSNAQEQTSNCNSATTSMKTTFEKATEAS